MDKLLECSWFPVDATPILDCLAALRDVKDKCFGWDLEDDWEEAISTFTSMYAELQEYATATLGLQLTVTWKIHIIACHLKPFFDKVISLILFICICVCCSSSVAWLDMQSRWEKAYMPKWSLFCWGTRGKQDTRTMETGSRGLWLNSAVTIARYVVISVDYMANWANSHVFLLSLEIFCLLFNVFISINLLSNTNCILLIL